MIVKYLIHSDSGKQTCLQVGMFITLVLVFFGEGTGSDECELAIVEGPLTIPL